MLFACAVVVICAASNAVVSAVAPPPLPPKIYYPVESAETYFQEHIKLHQRKYDAAEYIKRFEIFKTNLLKINALNSMYPRTVFGLTRFADLTTEEQNSNFGFRAYNRTKEDKTEKTAPSVGTTNAPKTFDWRDRGVVAPVKMQGICGSCYIFAAIGNIEGQYAIKHNVCISLSEQLELDCLKNTNCKGGWPHEVMQKLSQGHGCMKEEDYPYIDKDNQQCKEKADKVVVKITGGDKLNITDEKTLMQKLYDIGPLAIGIDPSDFHHYKAGILHPTHCSNNPDDMYHAVLLVGYGEEDGVKYWILKDSYGTQARENGYVRILRGVNACGVEADYQATAYLAQDP